MTYYSVLGLDKSCDKVEIRRQYKKLAAQYHPDQPTGNTKKFQEVQEAYECLSDDSKRSQYDMSINTPESMHGMFHNFFNMSDMFGDQRDDEKNNDIHLEFRITLMDVYGSSEVTTSFNRLVLVDGAGDIVKDPAAVTTICAQCKGMGIVQEILHMGFFSQQTLHDCQKCSGRGYNINSGYQLVQKRQKFRRKLPYGIEDESVLKLEGSGQLMYSRSNKEFRYGDLFITTKYDIAETNRQLETKYGFKKNIRISNVYSGNIDYIYSANIFEFITGTQFNLPLPNGRFLLIKINDLSVIRHVTGFGMPIGKTSCGDINIIFELKSIDPNSIARLHICETDKFILKRIANSVYPKPQSSDAIVVDFH